MRLYCGGKETNGRVSSFYGLGSQLEQNSNWIPDASCHQRLQLDFWKAPNAVQQFADIMASTIAAVGLFELLDQHHISYSITVDDVEKWEEEGGKRTLADSSWNERRNPGDGPSQETPRSLFFVPSSVDSTTIRRAEIEPE